MLSHPDAPNQCSAIVRCEVCGLRRLDPRPRPDVLPRYYPDRYGPYVGRLRSRRKQQLWNFVRDVCSGVRCQRMPSSLARALGSWLFDVNVWLGRRPQEVLEIGCGFGDLLIYLKSRGCEVQGIDFDSRAIAKASEYGLKVCSPQTFVAKANSYDHAILSHVLEHLPRPAETLYMVASVLRAGGYLHLAVPNGDSVGLRQEGASWGCLFHPIHLWYFDRNSLSALLERTGFEVLFVDYADISTNHINLWRSLWPHTARSRIFGQALRHLIKTAVNPQARDLLRIVARKKPQ